MHNGETGKLLRYKPNTSRTLNVTFKMYRVVQQKFHTRHLPKQGNLVNW